MLLATGPDRRSSFRTVSILVIFTILGVAQAFSSDAVADSKLLFPRPAALQPRVRFWQEVFTRYSWRDFVVHDSDLVWRIYGILHLPGTGPPNSHQARWARHHLKVEYRQILMRLAAGERPRTSRERRVARLFPAGSRRRFAIAARNLRVQEGLRERFRKILLRSRRYRPMMERIFRRDGLPIQLAVLPSIESGFYPWARSRAGAVGIWQFTRSTGRHYMLINRHHDERLNPFRATLAAAKLLRSNYEALKSWPLAITAYNYGTGGMLRAAAAYHHDYMRILNRFDGAAFGFAVKNYYSEFLAALEIYSDEQRYFPSLVDVAEARRSHRRSVYRVHSGDTLWDISRSYGVSVGRLAEANNLDNPHDLRTGLVLVIPDMTGLRHARRYRVTRGDTLWRISRRYGVTVRRLSHANQLRNPHHLQVGQVIMIPASRPRPEELTSE